MPQRITNNIMIGNYTRNQNAASVRLDKYQTQLATSRKIVRLSDDPVNTVKAITARTRLNNIGQYQKNLSDAKAWLTATESALSELNEVLKRCYELGVHAANDVLTDEDRNSISFEIRQMRDQVETLANTTLGDKFIFGGYNVTSNPYVGSPEDNDIFYTGDDAGWIGMRDIDLVDREEPVGNFIEYEINLGIDFEVGISGAAFMGVGTMEIGEDEYSRNIYVTLNEMYNALSMTSDDNAGGTGIKHEDIQPFITRLLELQKNTLTQVTEMGGRLSRIDLMQERYGIDEVNYTQMLSDVEDLDQAEAIMWFSMAEAVYRAALSVGGRILPPTLVDFMR